jgi:energy-coupling factor transporter ATP-binding protein EcfA2
MGTVQKEYERFLAWLRSQATTPDTRRLANLVLAHFDDLLPLGTGASARSKCLLQQAQKNFDALPDELPLNREESTSDEIPWRRLRRLEIGPFRGFIRSETFDLDRRIVLIYGPNGSGKSSFCEALEFALLGAIDEAEARRLAPQTYLTNAWIKHFEEPCLVASGPEGEDVPVGADADAFRFCFIEKNRIDDFSRLAAKTPGERTRLIATLFGVEGFDEFVRGFNDSLDSVILVEGPQRKALETARQNLKAAESLVKGDPVRRAELKRDGAAIAKVFKTGCSFDEMVTELGTPEHPGRLQELDRRLDQKLPQRTGLIASDLKDGLDEAERTSRNLDDLNRQLDLRRGEVSFKQLFQAIIKLRDGSPDKCPACDTPLTGPRAAATNPFEKAKTGLTELAELAVLEGRQEQAATQAATASRKLKDLLDVVLGVLGVELEGNVPLQEVLRALPQEPKGTWWSRLLVGAIPPWQAVLAAASMVERRDIAILAEEHGRENLKEERTRLRGIRDQILAHQTLEMKLDEDLATARAQIARFEEDNKALISAIPEEDKAIDLNRRIKAGYEAFLPLLRQYRDDLPGTLASGLNETTMGLYNGFNRADHESDKLVGLRLPVSGDDRIEVNFAGNPSESLDALHVLSEGHIRCIGLAILLAKNIQQRLPFLLFDDAVNAIDPDHKEGIRRTLFENQDLADKQIIVTCHGEEFIKDIENMLGADRRRRDCRSYVLLLHQGDHVIRVDGNPAPRNYVLSAQKKFERGEIQDAAAEGRRAVEAINQRIWKQLGKIGQGEVRLRMRGPKDRYEARDLAEQLRATLKKSGLQVPNGEVLMGGYDCLLDQSNWASFNRGTHEEADREDLDRGRIGCVLQALIEMDRCLSTPMHK